MDSSDSVPDERRRLVELDRVSEHVTHLDALAALARAEIRVFDHDLADGGWNTPTREDLLRTFLGGPGKPRLRVLLRETRYAESHCPRLRRLQRTWGHRIAFQLCDSEAMHAVDPFVLIDRHHYLHRFHFEQPRALAAYFDAAGALELATRFEALWSDSEPTLPPTTLGL